MDLHRWGIFWRGALAAAVLTAGCIEGTEQLSALDNNGVFDGGGPLGIVDGGQVADVIDGGALDPDAIDGGVDRCIAGEQISCGCVNGFGVQTCREDGTVSCCRCAQPTEGETLSCLRQGIVGQWRGVVTTPWVEPYRVEVNFYADGTYGARCLSSDNQPCAAYYYGLDGDRAGREYELFDVRADRQGLGRVRVVFTGNRQWGSIESLRLDDDDTVLTYEFWNTWGGRVGPIEFELERVR